MVYVIPILSAILFLLSFALFLFSEFTQRQLYFFFDPKWINFVIVFRMLAGFIIIAAAPASAAPMLLILVGIAVIFIAFTTPFTSNEKLAELGEWWLSLPILTVKLWALSWMVIWFLLGYIALPGDSYYALLFSKYLSKLLFGL